MEVVESLEQVADMKENQIILGKNDAKIQLKNTKIVFHGKNNIVFLEGNMTLLNSRIDLRGDNNLVILGRSKSDYMLSVNLYQNSVCCIGRDNYMNGKLNIIASEQKHCFIGNNGLFSFDIWLRTADPHLVYDCNTLKRKNMSKSIYIGDSVWVGQSAMILKGSMVGSGSIVGAMAMVPGKKIPSNTSWGGNPAKQIGRNVFFTKESVHFYGNAETKKSMKYKDKEFVFAYDEMNTKDFTKLDREISKIEAARERLEFLKKEVLEDKNKNRYYIAGEQKKGKLRKFLKK
ncbi:MAG: hypothetical protein K6G64_06140 [Eubacterium sp.]|nr:hypothetical protein [Eubacterium sp.]